MPLGFLLKAVSGIDYDSDELYKSPEHAAYIKNMCLDLNENSSLTDGTDGAEGDNAGVFTPIESNEVLCPMPLPDGANYVIGYHESMETNEGYVFVFNSLAQHLIYVIDGYTSRCQLVRQTPCLKFQLLPQHFIAIGRSVLRTVCYYNKATEKEVRRKLLIFTDNTPPIKFISVTDAIATDNYSLPFFKGGNCSECDMLGLALPTPDSCIQIEEIPRVAGDNRDNLLNNKAWQWRIKFTDIWYRDTEHGIISDVWYSWIGSCFQDTTTQPRCLKLTFDAGCVTIQKIQIEFRVWQANDPELSIPTDWFLHDTIDKYDQTNPDLEWWQRTINPVLNYDPLTNKISVVFCADKGTTAIPYKETSRNENPIARAASSVFNINKSIGTANHLKGFPPLDQDLLKGIKFEVEKPTLGGGSCAAMPRTITVYGHIRTMDGNSKWTQNIRLFQGHNVFGADNSKSDRLDEYHQRLPDGQTGFIGYFAGTTDWVYSTQCRLDITTGEIVEIGLGPFYIGLQMPGAGLTTPGQNRPLDGGGIGGGQPNPFADIMSFEANYECIQRWVFKFVTPGRRIFRVASVLATPNPNDYPKTSFPTYGTAKFKSLLEYIDPLAHEIVIDQCEGDVDNRTESLVLCDLTMTPNSPYDNVGINLNQINNVCTGYLYEDEVSRIPIEKAIIESTKSSVHPKYTDHNGLYFAVNRKKGWEVELYGTRSCARGQTLAISKTSQDAPGARYRDEKLYAYTATTNYPIPDRIYIKGRVVLCTNALAGVAGVLVMLTGGATALSDDTGNYTLIAHDNGDPSVRRERILYAQVGLCFIGSCDNPCSPCFDQYVSAYVQPVCDGAQRIFPMANLLVAVSKTIIRGPQTGGRYEVGIIPYYEISKPGFVQRTPDFTLDLPTIAEQGVYAFSRIKYTINPAIVFPLNMKYFTFCISKNLNYDNFLTWIVEKVEFVDNTGNVNTAAPSQIKLYYSGLIEYNLQNGFATNSVWQFLDANKAPVVGDKVEFVINGDGKFFTIRTTSLVKFDKDGSYILIRYTDDLKTLTEGAQIKLIRPRTNNNSHFFYEQCKVIRVTNGRIALGDETGYLNYFDSYIVNRQIPVPYYSIDPITKLITKDPAKSTLRTLTFPFEHHSPSDFWGDHTANRGRIYTVNPYENQQCRATEIQVSKAIDFDGVLNGLHYFSEGDITEFDQQEWGSITTVIAAIGSLTVICQQNNFQIPFDDNTVRVGQNNQLEAIPLNARLGRPRQKDGDSYGCHMEDINTISEYKGLIMFVDRSESALVTLYGGKCEDVSVQGFKGWLKDKIKHMLQFNRTDIGYMKYFHSTFDPRRKQYILTLFTIPVIANPVPVFVTTPIILPPIIIRRPYIPGEPITINLPGRNPVQIGETILPVEVMPIQAYVNQLRYKKIEANETIGYNPFEKSLKLCYSYTPEYYGTLFGHEHDNQLLSFKNGIAYLHHKKGNPTNKTYMNFYGVQCEAVYQVVLNIEANAVKRYQWTEVLCREQDFFCDEIITESGQRSRLLTTWWEKRENFYTADFKCNLLTYADINIPALQDPGKIILEGEPLSGKWIKVRYIGRSDPGKYFEFDGVHIAIFVSAKSGTASQNKNP